MCDTCRVPTTKPRYTITDTGDTAALLDRAAEAWPDVEDRKELLVRVLEAGLEEVERRAHATAERRERQLAAMRRNNDGIDVELLLSDAMWR